MKQCILLFLLVLLPHALFANTAVVELNQLLTRHSEVKKTNGANPQLNDLADNYYFVFIYRSTCPHCHKFAPILKDFSKTFALEVQGYSLDAQSLEGFSHKPLTPELFQTFYVSGGYKATVPALFLVNRHTLEAYAVLFGKASPYQLARRVNELQHHIEDKFHD